MTRDWRLCCSRFALLTLALACVVCCPPPTAYAQGVESDPIPEESEAPVGGATLPTAEVADQSIAMTIDAPLGAIRRDSINLLTVTLENAGPDFAGSLVVSTTSWVPQTQYFQVVDLPAGATKRYAFSAFEGTSPRYEVILLDAWGKDVRREPFTTMYADSSDVQIVQLGGHRSDFAVLQGEDIPVRLSLEDLVSDVSALKNNAGLSIQLDQEPDIPFLSYRYIEPASFPPELANILGLNLICVDLGIWSRLPDSQRQILTDYARLGGRLLFYPALDYGFPTTNLTDPLLPVGVKAGYETATLADLTSFTQRFRGWTPSQDRPLRFLMPDITPAEQSQTLRMEAPNGRALILTRREQYGQVALLTFQPSLLADGPAGQRQLVQLLDRSGLLEATQVQWYRDQNQRRQVGAFNRPWRPASPRLGFWLTNFAQGMNPIMLQPFRGRQSTLRFFAVPLRFLEEEGGKLLLWVLIAAGLTQLIVMKRRQYPWLWTTLPLASFLFTLTFAPAAVQLETPYRYEEWEVLRFPGAGHTAYLATASWIANLSRHATPQSLRTDEVPSWFFDEFVYGGGGRPTDHPTVRFRQGPHPAVVELEAHLMGQPRLLLGWGPIPVPGQLHGALHVSGDPVVCTLTLTNDTPWPFAGGRVYLENEYLYIQGAQVPALAPGQSSEVVLENAAVQSRADLFQSRPAIAPIFDVEMVSDDPTHRAWARGQIEILYIEDAFQQTLMFTQPKPDFAYTPASAILVGSLDAFKAPLLLDDREPEGRRLTLATCPIPITWEGAGAPVQKAFNWDYYTQDLP